MSFISVLDHVGEVIVKDFKKVAGIEPAVVNAVAGVAQAVEPGFDVFFPALAAAYNTTVSTVLNAQALGIAAAGSAASGPAKLQAVVTAVTPTLLNQLGTLGVKLDSATVTKFVQGVVDSISALSVPAADPVAIQAPLPAK